MLELGTVRRSGVLDIFHFICLSSPMETGHPEKILEHLTVNDPQGYPIPPPT